jgi:very-short-patch-repair endonuclease
MMDQNSVTCMVCGAVRKELNGHIRIHGLTSALYAELYPGTPISSMASRQARSNSLRGQRRKSPQFSLDDIERRRQMQRDRWANLKSQLGEEEYRKIKIESAAKMRAHKGENYKHSELTRAKMRGPRPHTTGRQFSEEHKRKISAAAKQRQNRGPRSESTKAKMREAWIKRKADKERYKAYVEDMRQKMSTAESIVRIRQNVAKRLQDPALAQKQHSTKIEKTFAQFLDSNNIEYLHQYELHTDIGIFVYDFFIPSMNMLIETDGEYWHGKSLEQINRDKIKIRIARSAGQSCVRISDKDWKPSVIFLSDDQINQHNDALILARLNRFYLLGSS